MIIIPQSRQDMLFALPMHFHNSFIFSVEDKREGVYISATEMWMFSLSPQLVCYALQFREHHKDSAKEDGS